MDISGTAWLSSLQEKNRHWSRSFGLTIDVLRCGYSSYIWIYISGQHLRRQDRNRRQPKKALRRMGNQGNVTHLSKFRSTCSFSLKGSVKRLPPVCLTTYDGNVRSLLRSSKAFEYSREDLSAAKISMSWRSTTMQSSRQGCSSARDESRMHHRPKQALQKMTFLTECCSTARQALANSHQGADASSNTID